MTTQDVMKFQNKKLKEGHSGDYLKKMHVYLVSLLNHAMKFYDLKQNVASLVGNFEIESQKRLNYWTLEQFNQFYDALATQQQNYSSNYCSSLGHVRAKSERSHGVILTLMMTLSI